MQRQSGEWLQNKVVKGKYEKTTKRLQYIDSEKSKNTIEGQKIMIQKGKLNASAHFFLKIQEIICIFNKYNLQGFPFWFNVPQVLVIISSLACSNHEESQLNSECPYASCWSSPVPPAVYNVPQNYNGKLVWSWNPNWKHNLNHHPFFKL